MNTSLILALATGCIILLGYIQYNREIFLGNCHPSIVSWALWSLTSILNFACYFDMTGNIYINTLPIVSSVVCLFTFLFVLYKNTIFKFTVWDVITFTVGVLAMFVWWWFQSAVYANMILQIAIIAGFIPTYRSVWNDPKNEKLIPWIIFVCAYILFGTSVVMNWSGNITDLIYPCLGIFLHLMVVLIMTTRKSYLVWHNLQKI